MIKRYILHIEFHWGYRPHISLRRAPRHGDRVVDGGEMGTLEACDKCSTVGFLHRADVDPRTLVQPEPTPMPDQETAPSIDINAAAYLIESPEVLRLDYTHGTRTYKTGETVWTRGAEYVVEGLTGDVLYLRRKDKMAAYLARSDERPERAVLEMGVGYPDYKIGDAVPLYDTMYEVEAIRLDMNNKPAAAHLRRIV